MGIGRRRSDKIRPIGVQTTHCRIPGKALCIESRSRLRQLLVPSGQVGVAVPGGFAASRGSDLVRWGAVWAAMPPEAARWFRDI